MGLLVLESCCCICTLKTGTKIIGWVGLVINILLVIQAVSTIFFIRSHSNDDLDPDIQKSVTTIKWVMWSIAITATASAIFSVLLLLGVYQDRENLVLSYAIVCGISVLVNIIQILVILIAAKDKMLALRQTVVTGFQIYFFLVVHSYYQTMDGGQRSYA